MATRPVENIEAVLGRFQAWAGDRNATEPGLGIREISVDEALASGRYRWKGARPAPSKKTDENPGESPEPAKVSAAQASTESQQKPQAAKAARSRQKAKVRERGRAVSEPRTITNGRVAAESKNGGGGNHCAAKPPVARGSASAKPAFKDALAEAIRPVEVVVAQPAALTRQAAISIRLAPTERALIQTRAAEAGITASAYIRQCALEVEQLRAQVKAAVALMGSRNGFAAAVSPVPAPTPYADSVVQPPVPATGFFGWMRRRLFPSRVPALALRA